MKELVIQIPTNCQIKYQALGENIYYDRILPIPMVENYGYVEGSKIQEDGDLADFYLISKKKFFPGTRIKEQDVVLIGYYVYLDQGQIDNKYLYVLKQELEEDTYFRMYLAYKICSIESYLHYYKNTINIVEKLVLSEDWSSSSDLTEKINCKVEYSKVNLE